MQSSYTVQKIWIDCYVKRFMNINKTTIYDTVRKHDGWITKRRRIDNFKERVETLVNGRLPFD